VRQELDVAFSHLRLKRSQSPETLMPARRWLISSLHSSANLRAAALVFEFVDGAEDLGALDLSIHVAADPDVGTERARFADDTALLVADSSRITGDDYIGLPQSCPRRASYRVSC
jgi:hypothetical protein